MNEKIRRCLRDIGLLSGIMREKLEPDPWSSAGPIMVKAALAESYLGSLYFYAIKLFGRQGRWSDSQYEIASAWYHAQKVVKSFIEYYDEWYPPGTFKNREATEYLDKLLEEALQETQCKTSPSTPTSM